ncbi:MAG: ATP-binding protein, partial [Anaerolineales bacterium]|nr:ATP-binding protein [Anaerolineales bacterium]
MRIAVASGKGGTGKTTVATSLALTLASDATRPSPLFLDCDVEAPNAHLFLRPTFERRQEVGILIPRVDEAKCTHCGKCAEVCQYHAIAVLGKKVLVFAQLCHGCGSCTLACPEHAISEIPDVMGILESGTARAGIAFARGVMNVGEPMAVPVIRQLKKWIAPEPNQIVIMDAPPGTACPVVESVRGADFLLLVTEPTPFGLHDLRLAAQIARELNVPAGAVVNRDGIGDAGVDAFCAAEHLPILMRIPFDRALAEGIARGQTLVDIRPEYIPRLQELGERLVRRHQSESDPG